VEKIKRRLEDNIKYSNELLTLFNSSMSRHEVNDIVMTVFNLIDSVSYLEADIYNYLRGRNDEV